MKPATQAINAFRQQFGTGPTIVARAPGRVNLLGAHVDYNEGWVLPVAIDRAVWLAAAPRNDDTVRVYALDFQEIGDWQVEASGSQSPNSNPQSLLKPQWLNYPAGVAWALQEAGYAPVGMDAVLTSTVPIGAGVSSSAAVEMAFALAWDALAGWGLDGLRRARLGQRAENGFLGVQSGIMDQYASANGAEGHAILLDCRALTHELIPIPAGLALLVADSGVPRALAGSEYNVRRRQCEEAVASLRPFLPDIRTLRDVTPAALDQYAHHLPELLQRRARHVVEECQRVLQGAALLRQGDLAAFGRLARASHVSSRDLYEVSIPELNVLAASAWDAPGCYGARLIGAGFGGCVLILAETGAVEQVETVVASAFERAFGRRPVIFGCQVAAGAAVEILD